MSLMINWTRWPLVALGVIVAVPTIVIAVAILLAVVLSALLPGEQRRHHVRALLPDLTAALRALRGPAP